MRIISKSRLRQFWETPGHEDAEGPLKAWYAHVGSRTVVWRTPNDVKAAIASASVVGNCIVFNVGGNKYRLVTRVLYPSQKVFVLKVMTHPEYDDGTWKTECGCYSPPPPKKAAPKGRPAVPGKPKRPPKGPRNDD